MYQRHQILALKHQYKDEEEFQGFKTGEKRGRLKMKWWLQF